MTVTKITKRAIDALQPVANKDAYLWDTELKGFGVKCTPTGSKVYLFKYQLGGRAGRGRRVTIGRHGALTPESARTKAKEHAANVARGVDVAAQEHADKQATHFSELSEVFLQRHVAKLAPRTIIEYRRLIENVLNPAFGNVRVADLNYEMIARFHHSMLATPVQANRAVAVLSKMMSLAIKRGDRPDRTNPAIGIEKFGETSRERVLSDAEIRTFWMGTDRLGFPFGPLFKLLLVTGQRRNEVAGMPWTEIDLDNAIWTIAAARAKNNRQHEVYLSPLAMRLLNVPRASNYVFSAGKMPPSGFSKAKSRLDRYMQETLGEALAAWRLHDLRRTAASGMAGLGIRAEIIEKTLNHTSGINSGLVRVYQRHEQHEARKQALSAWSARLLELVGSETT